MRDMRFLILAVDYPNDNGGLALAYVRTRNIYYLSQGAKIDVINFNTKHEYEIDNIKVHPVNWFSKDKANEFDLLICHAPNLRNHYNFLKKYGSLFDKKVFFFHGHEVLRINKVYSKPYPYINANKVRNLLQDLYDTIKLYKWRNYFEKNSDNSYCIFVSNWMREEFYKWTKIPRGILKEYITYNSVGEKFELENWDKNNTKKYDFITIRAYLDGSKYCVDVVNQLAFNNPDLNFLLVGKGDFFKYNDKAPNITWFDARLTHDEMCELLDLSKCGLMPTRTDAQGVMMCEMATYGMPLITSDIPVCHEVFDGFEGIGFIDNDNVECNLKEVYDSIKNKSGKDSRYYFTVLGAKEFDILKGIVTNVI